MPKVTDTYERAYEACGVLAARGLNPTVKTVAEYIGTNSPAIISPAIKDWKQSLAAESLRRLEIPDVPERLVESTIALWRLAVEEAQLTLAKEKAALAEEKVQLNALVGKSEAAHQAMRQDYTHYRERAEQEREALRATVAQLEADKQQLVADQSQTLKALALAREANASLNGSLEETQRTHQRQQGEWEEKFDRDHAWHLTRIAEERERAKQEEQEKIARLEEALALSRQHVATLNGYLDASATATGELRGELKAVREEKARLLQELDALRGQLSASAQQGFAKDKALAAAQTEVEKLQGELNGLQSILGKKLEEIKNLRAKQTKPQAGG
jgi:chromosome segregation ATPase